MDETGRAVVRRGGLGREFWTLWAASGVANLGDGVLLVAGPALAAALTRDPALVAGLAVAQRLPWLLFALPSGALVDRLDRRRLLGRVAVARALVLGAVGIAVSLGVARLPLLYAAFFLLGTAETLFDTAAVAILPEVVGRDALARANARLAGAQTVANEFAAPPLGGALFALAAAAPFLLGAGASLATATLVRALRGAFGTAAVPGAPLAALPAEIAEGVRWLWRQRLLRTLGLALGLMNATLAAQVALLVLLAEERLGLGTVGYGLLLSAMASGGLAAGAVAERVIARLGQGRTLLLGLLIEACTAGVLALARHPLVAGVALALFGFHLVVWGVLTLSLRQALIPSHLFGRANGAYRLLANGGAALGALAGGVLARHFGITAPNWASFAILLALFLVVRPRLGDRAVAEARQGAPAGGRERA